MTACNTPAQLTDCLPLIRRAIVPMCRANAKRLRCDPEELVNEVVERIFLRLASGQRVVNVVRYARRYARCYAKQACQRRQSALVPEPRDRPATAADPLDGVIDQEECLVVRQAIETLPAADRRIIVAILHDEPPPVRYRDMLGRRMQALRLLRERLERRGICE